MAYNINWLTESNAWDSKAYPLSIFGTMEFLEIDSKSMFTSLLYMADFIRSRKALKGKVNDIPELKDFGEAVWSFLSSIYESGWDSIYIDRDKNSLRNRVSSKFTSQVLRSNIY